MDTTIKIIEIAAYEYFQYSSKHYGDVIVM